MDKSAKHLKSLTVRKYHNDFIINNRIKRVIRQERHYKNKTDQLETVACRTSWIPGAKPFFIWLKFLMTFFLVIYTQISIYT